MQGSEKRYIWTVYTEITMSERNICRHKTRPGWSFNEEHRSKCNTLGALNDEARITKSKLPETQCSSVCPLPLSSRQRPSTRRRQGQGPQTTEHQTDCFPPPDVHTAERTQCVVLYVKATMEISSKFRWIQHQTHTVLYFSAIPFKPYCSHLKLTLLQTYTYNVLVRGAGNGWASRGGRQKKCAV